MDWMFGINPTLGRNPEFQSAVSRIAIWTFGFGYIGIGALTGYYKVDIPDYLGLSAGYLAFAVGLLLSVLRRPCWESRRYFSLALDITATSLAIFLTREAISPFYLIYIWIFISAATRYGRTHLVVASAAAVVSYNIVLVVLDEWQRHTFEAFFFLLLLVLLPLFQYALLHKVKQARDDAERANRAKGDFLARMTHELRTPLTGVIGMAELLQSTRLDAEQSEYVQSIASSAELLGGLIGDILDLSKIDARKLTLELIPFDPGRAAQEVCDLFESQALAKHLKLILDIAPDVPRQVVGDPLRVRQILLNLLGNAIKFTDNGEVVLKVSASPPSHGIERPHLLFSVRDTGIGIAREQLDTIFESFQQADDSTTRRYGGSGLGTTIARELTLLMGGTIEAESEVGRGSRFLVRLPLEAVSAATPEPDAIARVPGQEDAGFGATAEPRDNGHDRHGTSRPLRVLVAEDNEISARVITAFLTKLGCRPVRVDDGEAALTHARRHGFDIAFIDLRMPKLDGLQFTRAYRALEKRRHRPIVALTANAAEDVKTACLAAGMDAFLSKPVKQEQLKQMIARLVPGDGPIQPCSSSDHSRQEVNRR